VSAVALWSPAEQLVAEDQERRSVMQDEGAVGQLAQRRCVMALSTRRQSLTMKLGVDRVGSDLPGVKIAPDRHQALVIRVPA
jgi:hypothetical protein